MRAREKFLKRPYRSSRSLPVEIKRFIVGHGSVDRKECWVNFSNVNGRQIAIYMDRREAAELGKLLLEYSGEYWKPGVKVQLPMPEVAGHKEE